MFLSLLADVLLSSPMNNIRSLRNLLVLFTYQFLQAIIVLQTKLLILTPPADTMTVIVEINTTRIYL